MLRATRGAVRDLVLPPIGMKRLIHTAARLSESRQYSASWTGGSCSDEKCNYHSTQTSIKRSTLLGSSSNQAIQARRLQRALHTSHNNSQQLSLARDYSSTTSVTSVRRAGTTADPSKKRRKRKRIALNDEDLQKLEEVRLKNAQDSTQTATPAPKTLSSNSQQRAVPTGRLMRAASFAPMITKIGLDILSPKPAGQTQKLSDSATDSIVKTFSKARGAALKIGQMISMQDENVIPPHIANIFTRVRESADYMPFSQVEQVLKEDLGSDWREKFADFEDRPFAAASIGQVHRGVLPSGEKVAVKVQYPGIADSVDSDMANLKMVLPLLQLPKNLFINESMTTLGKELHWECDYVREADCQVRMGDYFNEDPVFRVPVVHRSHSTARVLTSEFVEGGVPVDECLQLSQETRNIIVRNMIRLAFTQLFSLQFMQTDPNFANYLWVNSEQKMCMIDFGASQEYSDDFIEKYIEIINGAVENKPQVILEKSREVGFLTGFESKAMEDAHVDSVLVIGEFIRCPGDYDFTKQKVTKVIAQEKLPTMVKERLTPPPKETYSVNRALAGVFNMASKLQANKVHSLDLWQQCYNDFHAQKSE